MIFAAQVSVVSTIFSVFTLSCAVNTVGMARSTMLTVLILANAVALVAIPLFAALSDRIGRRPVFMFGALGSALLIWPYLWAIGQSNVPAVFGFGVLLYGELFATRVRLSGIAIGTQIGFALGGFAPTTSAAIGPSGDGWMPVAAFVSVTGVIAAASVYTAKETFRTPMRDLGA